MKRLFLLLALLPLPALATVAVIPNTGSYPISSLSGSTRQLSVNVTGGTLNTINWSCATGGGATCSFSDLTHTNVSSIAAALPTVTLNVGGTTNGSCTITGSIGSYTASAANTITVTAQSVDDTSKSATFTVNVCGNQGATLANGDPSVRVLPFYYQLYPGQPLDLQSFVVGKVDQTGVWSITAQPGGGDGTLVDTTKRDTVFTATVTGHYTVTYTSNVSGSNYATIFVVSTSLPSYAVTPNGTRPFPCAVDSTLTGPVYDIGPTGHTYATISATPAFNTISAGTMYRIFNTDLTGLSPTTYPEYFQISKNGTQTNPIIYCGVPDSLGNLPVQTGNNATGQASINPGDGTVGYGILSLWTESGHSWYWQSGLAPPQFVLVGSMSFQSANPTTTYTQPGGTSASCMSGVPAGSKTVCNWSSFTAATQARSGKDIVFAGIESNNVPQGVFTDDSQNNYWSTYTQDIWVDGSNLHNIGWAGTGSHGMYLQSLYVVVQGNHIGPAAASVGTPENGPSGIKSRSGAMVARYNVFDTGLARAFDDVDNEDGSPYVSMDQYLSYPSASNCDLSVWCLGDTAGQAVVAAYNESSQSDFFYGNTVPWEYGGNIHYGGDGGVQGYFVKAGTLYAYSNTYTGADDLFDDGSPGGYFVPTFDVRNSIVWPHSGGLINNFTRYADQIFSATTNLFQTSSLVITPPINSGPSGTQGWAYSGPCSIPCQWPLYTPMQTHMPGLGTSNYLFTSTQPYTSGTLIPPSGSAAIGAGTSLTGLPAQLPVRWQINPSTNVLTPRLHPLTLGALDESGTTTSTYSGFTGSGSEIR